MSEPTASIAELSEFIALALNIPAEDPDDVHIEWIRAYDFVSQFALCLSAGRVPNRRQVTRGWELYVALISEVQA